MVLGEFPPPRSNVRKGATVHLTVYGAGLTNGPTVRIPDLVGTLEWRAVNAIADRGLRVVVLGPRHSGSGYQFWSIVWQSPSPGTALPVGAATVEIRMQTPPAVTVTSRIPASNCASSETHTIHVIAAYTISSAQLRLAPITDGGPLSRQPSGALWRMCYVVGPDAAVGYGGGGSANHAIDVFYRNGSLAEVVGQDYPFQFKVVQG
jgi:PASTA domain